ncbi:MAG: FAD-dependent oxidoreductase, partial [Gammaproteobacteria bacterium]|nr:FAD-dependent oxidoreductase [Gammaproteobacteria bacterium]
MSAYRYLITGGGMAADAAVRGIRQIDGDGAIGLVSREPHAPYRRPLLSKGLWLGKPRDRIWLNTEGLGVTLHLGKTVTELDLHHRVVVDDEGTAYRFEKLLIATGGEPRRLPFGGDHIIYFRTFADYLRLWDLAEARRRFAVIGGGFIGSEIAAALTIIGKNVVMAFPEDRIGSRVFPHDLAEFVTGYFTDRGVEVLPGHTLLSMSRAGTGLSLGFQSTHAVSNHSIEVEAAVAGLGIQPAVTLAEQAGLCV